jgi:hypothetical protein
MEGDAMIAGLKGETYKMPFNLNMMMLRAKFNSQRSYEIYIFESEDMDYDLIKDMFDNEPQSMVNAIRKNGRKLYSDYSKKEKVIS